PSLDSPGSAGASPSRSNEPPAAPLRPAGRFTSTSLMCPDSSLASKESRMTRSHLCGPLLAAALLTMDVTPTRGDEGMWLFNHPPTKILQDRYGFTPTPQWLEHVQKSSVRFNSGGSGSFVSADGLVMTNHHVAADALQKLGTKDKNYYRDGFHARTRAEELKCEVMELNVLIRIEYVTERVT